MIPRIEIHYCTRCRWLLRASWISQELLSTFAQQLGEVALIPSSEAGTFQVYCQDNDQRHLIWDRRQEERFPEAKELKQAIRDIIKPDMSLGHSDR